MKVGDKVMYTGRAHHLQGMDKYIGKVLTVNYTSSFFGVEIIGVEEISIHYFYTDWFVPVNTSVR